MRIQTFRAATIQQALQLVRERLGPDACVLSSKEIRRGFFTRRWVEVEASREVSVPNGNPTFSEAALEICAQLTSSGADSSLADQLVQAAVRQCEQTKTADTGLLWNLVIDQISQRLHVDGGTPARLDHPLRLCSVGPTGVGKTVLLTKLARRATQERRMEVGIVSVDSWRNGSMDGLFQCADAISAQLEMVSGAAQLSAALERLRTCGLVLIDTWGCTAQDQQQLSNLKELLHICQPDETHLVLSATTASQTARSALNRFAAIGATHLDLTKIDEASGLGQWISVLSDCPIPVQVLAEGPSSLGKITSPSPRDLARTLIGQALQTSGGSLGNWNRV
jgi:flagellar biosynthesis protein FlhF